LRTEKLQKRPKTKRRISLLKINLYAIDTIGRFLCINRWTEE
jgi:hypothetical protein